MRKQFALLALLLAAPLAGNAGEIDYTFVEAGAARFYPEWLWGVDEATRYPGAYIAGSVALNEHFYAYGDISRTTRDDTVITDGFDRFTYNYRHTHAQVGLGARYPLQDRTDALVELAYVHLRSRTDRVKDRPWPYPIPERLPASTNAKGARLNIGVREAFTGHIEGWLKVGYQSMNGDGWGPFSGESSYNRGYSGEAGLQVKITPRVGVVANAQFLHDYTIYQLGVRANF